jgi:hypothetical protein
LELQVGGKGTQPHELRRIKLGGGDSHQQRCSFKGEGHIQLYRH